MDPFAIQLLSNHWLSAEDDPTDYCSHGQVYVRIGTEVVVDQGEPDRSWTTSAMAVHLLRTLEHPHQPQQRVGEHLIPCCGFHLDHLEGDDAVHIQGCMTGHNFWVAHGENCVMLTTTSGMRVDVPFEMYRQQVLNFADAVEDLYTTSKPKKPIEDAYDRAGYALFWKEWRRRRGQ